MLHKNHNNNFINHISLYCTIMLFIFLHKSTCSQEDCWLQHCRLSVLVHQLLFSVTLGQGVVGLKSPDEKRVHVVIQQRALQHTLLMHAHLSSRTPFTECLCSRTATASQTTNCYHVFTHSKPCFNSKHI